MMSNSPLEMAMPLREFAARDKALGGTFSQDGEVCVDKCCEFTKSIDAAMSGIATKQDLQHWLGRIMGEILQTNPHRNALVAELRNALVEKKANGQGSPTVYRHKDEQIARMDQVFMKYSARTLLESSSICVE